MSRTADYVRKTKETDITLSLELDGSGVSEIDTGIGFFDHMLEGFARHGFFDLFDGNFTVERVGYMDTEMVKEFFYAISYTAGMNLHIKVLTPGNNHHMIEAMFKAFARALDEATSYDPRITDILSTKGSL